MPIAFLLPLSQTNPLGIGWLKIRSIWAADVPHAPNGHSSFELICAFDVLEHWSSLVNFANNYSYLSYFWCLVLMIANTASGCADFLRCHH